MYYSISTQSQDFICTDVNTAHAVMFGRVTAHWTDEWRCRAAGRVCICAHSGRIMSDYELTSPVHSQKLSYLIEIFPLPFRNTGLPVHHEEVKDFQKHNSDCGPLVWPLIPLFFPTVCLFKRNTLASSQCSTWGMWLRFTNVSVCKTECKTNTDEDSERRTKSCQLPDPHNVGPVAGPMASNNNQSELEDSIM